jgi:predicted nucleic acid-binding protein
VIVADSNLIAYLTAATTPEFELLAEQAYRKDGQWCAPYLWRSEFMNVLSTAVRAGRIPIEAAQKSMRIAVELMEANEHASNYERVLELAAETGTTAYDCEFVALAERLKTKLVTNDKQLRKAFPALTVSIQEFIQS